MIGKRMSWEKAIKHAKTLDLAGHKDWRLPTIEELNECESIPPARP